VTDRPTQDLPADPGTVVQHGVPDVLRDPDRPAVPGYELLDEVGRGGMGVVYRARDVSLGRDVAVKLLLARFPAGGAAARRFADEARITAQLQHPGIPPVHAVGSLPDGRPFLAMKLIKGRTLGDLLAGRGRERPDASPNLVAVFEAVCQAVGYAHAHGVVHRDLKPSNVMVGSFGEVQVMDWGLAKVLTGPPRQHGPAAPADATAPATAIGSTRDEGDETQAGAVLGTPAFMPPEQAIGAVDQIDARSDVFGLGAILCTVLTGHPPYLGADAESTRQLAARGKLDGARARLAGCGADPGLAELCRRCLSAEPADRPADGGAVAAAVAALRAAADERVRRAETDRATAEVRAAGERKRRRVQRALFAAGLLALGAAGVGAWLVQRQAADRERAEGEAARERAVRGERAKAGVEAALARLPGLYGRFLWREAADGLAAADALLGPDGDPALRGQVAAARRDTALLARLDKVRLDKSVWVVDRFDYAGAVPKYAAALREYGLDLAAGEVADLARRVNGSAVREHLLAALDDYGLSAGAADRARAFAVTAAATGQGWRAELAAAYGDPGRLAAVYDAIPEAERSPALVAEVGAELARRGGDGGRRLTAGLRQYPSDFWIHLYRGVVAGDGPGGRLAERQAGASRAALAVRPGTPAALTNLGFALRDGGDLDGAVAAAREAIRLDPNLPVAHGNLAGALHDQGKLGEALAAAREAVRLDPNLVFARSTLGWVLHRTGDTDAGLAATREAIRLNPGHAQSHLNLGSMLRDRGDPDGAAAAYREAARLDPKDGWPRCYLGRALHAKRDLDGALAAYREAVRLDPASAEFRVDLAYGLIDRGDLAGGVAAARAAVVLDPGHAMAHNNLGVGLRQLGDRAGAAAAAREAARLDPGKALFRRNLGDVLREAGDADGAVAAYREALRLDPDDPDALCHLGNLLRDQGRPADALPLLRKGHDLGRRRKDWDLPSAGWVERCERLVELDRRLPAVKAGADAPDSPAEAAEFARLAARPFRKEYALAVRLYAGLLAADPDLVAPDSRASAARAAVRAAAGDDPSAACGWDEWYLLLDRAHGWLAADLAEHRRRAGADDPDRRKRAAALLADWLADADLAPARDPARLAAMPAAERARWEAFWAEVEEVRKLAAK
jgi:tetratricopeptide (TPR) repeat protein/tRNA A-37 threonylcarbamoyl transferase component Bud32